MFLQRFRPLVASSLLGLTLALTSLPSQTVLAQPKPPADADAGDSAPVEQIALSDKQIQSLIEAQKAISAITSKLPPSDDAPSPKVQAQLEATAKKSGFANYAEYDKIAGNAGLVMAGFDPDTKAYIGPEAVIKKQIAEVNADKQMSAKDKKEALDSLNASLKTIVPVKFPDNIKVVGKYYDQLAELMQQD